MKKLIPLFIFLISIIAGMAIGRNQLAKVASESASIPTSTINHKLNVSVPTSAEPTEIPHPMCDMTKQEVLLDGYTQGIKDANELKKLSATYDLLCFGETDTETPESVPQVIREDRPSLMRDPTPTIDNSFQERWDQEQKDKCQQEINEYQSCMSEYNAKMAEYNSCLVENSNKVSPLTGRSIDASYSCLKPYSYCSKPSSLC